ncbi:MAG TPA: biopolymer transporter ExbD [Planctomycetota bacterium]|nr:biopolymer transporter ExbD [Planctomycetota bacterium]
MQLAKDEKGGDILMDMTPMIDCVFQLIIFFMLITDMSQKELEDLYLPKVEVAAADKPKKGEIRPIVNILSDGSIWVKRECYFDPKADDKYKKLKEYLARMAKDMPKGPIFPDKPNGPKAPMNPLLIRADQATPAKYVQKVMEVCGTLGIQIWKVELAAGTDIPKDGKPKPVTTGGQ